MRAAAAAVLATAVTLTVALLPAVAATAGAGAWDPPQTISDPAVLASAPQVVSDGTTITAAWQVNESGQERIRASSSTDAGLTWSVPTLISPSGDDGRGPQLVTDGTTITLVWFGGSPGTSLIHSSSSSDDGHTWSAPIAVSAPGGSAAWPQIVSHGGILTATWSRDDGVSLRLQASSSSDGGATWSVPVTINDAGEYTATPQIATDGALTTIVWHTFGFGPSEVKSASSPDGGLTWSAPVTVAGGIEPHLAIGGGVITAAWYAYDGVDYRIQVSSSSDGGATWTVPVRLSSLGGGAYRTEVTTDGTTIVVFWDVFTAGPGRIESARSIDGGATWSAEIPVDDTSFAAALVQVTDDGTTLTAAWYSTDSATSSILTAFSADRGLSWSVPVNLSGAAPSSTTPQIVDGGATTTVVWIDELAIGGLVRTSSFTVVAPVVPGGPGGGALLPPTGLDGVPGAGALALAVTALGLLAIGMAARRGRAARVDLAAERLDGL